jgi:hypothetical protein
MKFQRTYIDEQPLAAMIQPALAVGLDEMQTIVPHLGKGKVVVDQIRRTAETLQQRVIASGKKVARVYSKQPGGGQWQGKIDLWTAAQLPKARARAMVAEPLEYLLESSHLDLFKQGINLNAALWLADAVGNSVACVQVDVRNPRTPITFERLIRHRLPKKAELTVLDATTSPEELAALFLKDFELLSINVNWEGQRIWLRQGMGKTKTANITEEQLGKYLQAMASHIPPDVDQALLVTHQHVEEKSLNILKNFRPDIRWASTHYFASRGLNAFEDCQAVLCFGVPVASPGALADIATVLFTDDPARQVRWQQQQNEGELYQCAHRARFIRHPGRTLVVMGHFWPKHLLGAPDLIIDGRRNQHSENPKQAAERIASILDVFGFVTKEVASWVGVGARKDAEKVQNTREAWQTFVAEIKSGQASLSVPSYINNISLLGLVHSPMNHHCSFPTATSGASCSAESKDSAQALADCQSNCLTGATTSGCMVLAVLTVPAPG